MLDLTGPTSAILARMEELGDDECGCSSAPTPCSECQEWETLNDEMHRRNIALRGEIVTYTSPAYGCDLRVRAAVPITTPDRQSGYDAVVCDENGVEDFTSPAGAFTHVWFNVSQIVKVGS